MRERRGYALWADHVNYKGKWHERIGNDDQRLVGGHTKRHIDDYVELYPSV